MMTTVSFAPEKYLLTAYLDIKEVLSFIYAKIKLELKT
jgi:hypothetical protein